MSLIHDAQEIAILNGREVLNIKSLDEAYSNRLSMLHDYIRLSDRFEIKHQYNDNNQNLYMDLIDVEIYDTDKGFVNTERIIRNISTAWLDVNFSNGRRLLCTEDHPLTLRDGRTIHASELKLKDRILINSYQYNEENIVFNEDKAWL